MHVSFADRIAAGRTLATRLEPWRGLPGLLVLALPRGGVPVAREIATALGAPLDVLVVRKLGVPGAEEVACGAIAAPDIRVLNEAILTEFDVAPRDVERIAARERRELLRREHLYRRGRPAPEVRGRSVIVVDDGIATGATVRAALAVLQQAGAGHVTVATPVAARAAYVGLRARAADVVALHIPKEFTAVGAFYDDFRPVDDAAVVAALDAAVPDRIRPAVPADQAGRAAEGSARSEFRSRRRVVMARPPAGSRGHSVSGRSR